MFSFLKRPPLLKPKELYKEITPYGVISVTETNGLRRLLIDDLYTHSIYKPDLKPTGDVYWDYFLVSRAFLDRDPISICILGLGGGTAVHYYDRYFRPERIDGVEINPAMTKVARDYFDLNYQNLKIINQGAVEYMRETVEKYDLILVDLYEGGGQAKNCNSPEFYADIKRSLADGGLVAVNRFSLHSHHKLNEEFLASDLPQFIQAYSVPIKNNIFYFFLSKKIDLKSLNINLSNLSHLNSDLEFIRHLNIEPVMYNIDRTFIN